MKESENKNNNKLPSSGADWQSASEWFSQRQNERINTTKGRYDPSVSQNVRREEEQRKQQMQAREKQTRQEEMRHPQPHSEERHERENAASNQRKKESSNILQFSRKNRSQGKSKDELRREYAEKTRKRRKRRIIEWFVFTALIFVAIFVVASLTVLFHIEEIKVEGDTRYSVQQIVEASCVEVGDNLWRTHTSDVSAKVSSALPYVGRVSISRKIPSTIVLKVEETVPVYAIKTGKKFILIDKTDKVLEMNAKSSNKVLVIEGVVPGDIKEGEKFKTELEENYQTAKDVYRYAEENELNINKIDVGDINNICAVCNKVLRLDFGSASQLSEKMVMANEVISKLKEDGSLNEGVINLKSTTKAFYKDGPIETTKKPDEPVTDADGNVITTEPMTDADGNVITTEPVTDENGEPVSTEPMTDENGNSVSTEPVTGENGSTTDNMTTEPESTSSPQGDM